MVLPIGPPRRQQMTLLTRKEEGVTGTELGAVSFVPLIHGD
jgi:protein-L-isoaspartate O-methyltransferase